MCLQYKLNSDWKTVVDKLQITVGIRGSPVD